MRKFLRFAAGLLPPFRKRAKNPCPPRQELEAFVRGLLEGDAALHVLRHLLPGCPACQEITSALWWAGEGRRVRGGPVALEEPAVDRVLAKVRGLHAGLERERAAARPVCAELARCRVTTWGVRLQGVPRTWGFCELLLAESGASRDAAPDLSAAFALLAMEVAAEVPAALHPPGFVADLAARAWIGLSASRRAQGDLDGAEAALQEAETELARGSGERPERARLSAAWAALRCGQGRHGEAERWQGRALVVYRRLGQADLLGRGFVQLGAVRARAGNLAGAAVALRQGLALADAVRDPETACAALYVLDGLGAALTSHSPAAIAANPAPSTQPNRSPRKAAASTAATSGCSVV